MKNHLNDKDRSRIKQLASQGYTYLTIATRLGVSISTVRRNIPEGTRPIQESKHEQSNGSDVAGR